jgi:hypothetical protein
MIPNSNLEMKTHDIMYPNTICLAYTSLSKNLYMVDCIWTMIQVGSKCPLSFSTREQHLCKEPWSTSWMSMKSSHDSITRCVYALHKHIKVEYCLVWQPTGCYTSSRILTVHESQIIIFLCFYFREMCNSQPVEPIKYHTSWKTMIVDGYYITLTLGPHLNNYTTLSFIMLGDSLFCST